MGIGLLKFVHHPSLYGSNIFMLTVLQCSRGFKIPLSLWPCILVFFFEKVLKESFPLGSFLIVCAMQTCWIVRAISLLKLVVRMSVVYTFKKRGARTKPCGTPFLKSLKNYIMSLIIKTGDVLVEVTDQTETL